MTIPFVELRRVFDYRDGHLYWRVKASDRTVVGKQAGGKGRTTAGYAQIGLGGKVYYAHRLIWAHQTGAWPASQIDHIDRDKANNRIENLREANSSENVQNRGLLPNNTSGVTGVSRHARSGKWAVDIWVDKKKFYLGLYDSFDRAADVRAEAVRDLHPFAVSQ